jgi:hypothetical protein
LGVPDGVFLQSIEGSNVLREHFFRVACKDLENDISRPDALDGQLRYVFRDDNESIPFDSRQEDVSCLAVDPQPFERSIVELGVFLHGPLTVPCSLIPVPCLR